MQFSEGASISDDLSLTFPTPTSSTTEASSSSFSSRFPFLPYGSRVFRVNDVPISSFAELQSAVAGSRTSNIKFDFWAGCERINVYRNEGEPLGLETMMEGSYVLVKGAAPSPGCAQNAVDWRAEEWAIITINGQRIASNQQLRNALPPSGPFELAISKKVSIYLHPVAAGGRMGTDSRAKTDPAAARDKTDPESWSVAQLKSVLDSEYVDRSDCIEKSDLVARVRTLQEHHWNPAAAGLKTLPRPSQPSPQPPPSSQSQRNDSRSFFGFFSRGRPEPAAARNNRQEDTAPQARSSATVSKGEFDDKDFYELLEAPKDATESQLRKSYYKVARECHPDKARGDARMEAKFKAVCMAYEVLSDPEKRKAYDLHGRHGVDMATKMSEFDFKPLVRMVFGGEGFATIFGDVCEMPALKQLLQQLDMKDLLTNEASTDHIVWNRMQQEEMMLHEEQLCQELAVYLISRLEQHADPSFKLQQQREGASLVDIPGGHDLLKSVSYVYMQEAEQYAGGLTGIFAEMQERAHLAAEGLAMTSAAVSVIAKVKSLERKQAQAAGITLGSDTMTNDQKMAAMMKAREDENVRRLEAEVMSEGLSAIWRIGKLLIEQRVRRVVELALEPMKKDKGRLKAFANALLLVSKEWNQCAINAERAQKFDIRNHVMASATAATVDAQESKK